MMSRALALHIGVIAVLFAAQFLVSEYISLSLTRIMLLAIYAMGYNLLFGYTGLLSLGHAMFFATGLYVAALGTTKLGLNVPVSFGLAIVVGAAVSTIIGSIALRATGVAFMIITLMFSQAAFLTVLYFGDVTRGDEGIVIPDTIRKFEIGGVAVDLTSAVLRYNLALLLMAIALLICAAIVKSSIGRVLIAIRENESRTEMLGYNVVRYKFFVMVASGTLSALAGAAYALMFAYAGSTLASIQYSIHPLLWTLLGGAATLLGPLLGTALMFALTDLASSFANANLLAVGVVLIVLVLFFPKGILGTVRAKWLGWLP